MKRIFVDRRVWRDSRDNWVSFESDPKLRVTKNNIYGRCVPCITHLYRQLQEKKDEIELREAYHCWKVVAVLKDKEECLEVLREYEENFLRNQHVKGKFGSSLPTTSSKVLMFHMEDEKERDRLYEELNFCVQKVNPVRNSSGALNPDGIILKSNPAAEQRGIISNGVNSDSRVFYQRACANLYYDLLGDWKDWKEVTKIKNPAIRSTLMERIKRLLYWEKEG